jgi:hypothetical protein
MSAARPILLPGARLSTPTVETGRTANSAVSDYEFTISLRIRHPTVDPGRITEALGILPQHTWKAGDRRRDPAGVQLEGDYRESYWMARLMEQPQLSSGTLSVETVLVRTLDQLRRSHAFLKQLNADGGVAELQVSLYARQNFRLELIAASLTLLARLGLAIALDVHLHTPNSVQAN